MSSPSSISSLSSSPRFIANLLPNASTSLPLSMSFSHSFPSPCVSPASNYNTASQSNFTFETGLAISSGLPSLVHASVGTLGDAGVNEDEPLSSLPLCSSISSLSSTPGQFISSLSSLSCSPSSCLSCSSSSSVVVPPSLLNIASHTTLIASSVAATEGSPPSSPRSTLSSLRSFQNISSVTTPFVHSERCRGISASSFTSGDTGFKERGGENIFKDIGEEEENVNNSTATKSLYYPANVYGRYSRNNNSNGLHRVKDERGNHSNGDFLNAKINVACDEKQRKLDEKIGIRKDGEIGEDEGSGMKIVCDLMSNCVLQNNETTLSYENGSPFVPPRNPDFYTSCVDMYSSSSNSAATDSTSSAPSSAYCDTPFSIFASSSSFSSSILKNVDFDVCVHSEDFKFCCAHFVAFRGFREKLHGHNYTAGLRVGGPIHNDGYVMDFQIIKNAIRTVCNSLNGYFIVPMRSDVLDITEEGDSMNIVCEDGSLFKFPKSDCLCLPIVHSTAEELAAYVLSKIVDAISYRFIQLRFIQWLEITISERPNQSARFTYHFNRNKN